MATPKDVVFIHGMFMNPKSWGEWVKYFAAKGFRCHTVAWPGHDADPAELRKSPPAVLRSLRLEEVVQVHRDFLKTLSAKPLLIGHSVGGLITQKLINEGLAAGAAALDSAPPQGIFVPSWTFLKTNFPVVNPFAGDDPFQFTVEQFQFAFCNSMTLDETRAVYEQFVCPESRNVARSVAGSDAKLDWKKPHAPLLLLGGELDNIVPWKLNEKNHKAYRDEASVTEFKLLPGRTHFLCGQKGWEETATLVHDWLVAKVS
jgi:pimeloyl-ACP methyl ester carboxylesterase